MERLPDPVPDRLSIGDRFPDIDLVDHRGRVWNPADRQGRPLVAIFHRHLA